MIIRNFAADDWQDLQEAIIQYQASEWAKYEDPWPTSDDDMKGIVSWFAQGDEYLAVCVKASSKVIGFVAINRRDEKDEKVRNLGYIFNPVYSGQGYATESCSACMDYVFNVLKVDRILTGTHPDNEPSVRLLKRLQLRTVDHGEWTMTRDEWLALHHQPD